MVSRMTCLAGVCAVLFVSGAYAREGTWIKLYDGESTFGWLNVGDADWSVENGTLIGKDGTGGMLATTTQFKDFNLTARIRVKPGCSTGLVVRSPLDGHPTENGASVVWLSTPKGEQAAWNDIAIRAAGANVTATVNGEQVGLAPVGNEIGHVGLLYHHNGGAVVEISEVRLQPIELESIFNGRNLDGWNIIPDRKSKFSVIGGALNIKDGNGQIETAGTYKNFLLQLDIISNGEHLNSGVFFRGPVGVFWKGYESQVRNQWQRDDRTKPVDYGTGGIYGDQAARKVISTDNEWFNKTVVMNGNHVAVWIDGYQVSDFHDTRPVSRNADAKSGFVPDAGTIHLQGHDPTTDLSFKNIYIQGY